MTMIERKNNVRVLFSDEEKAWLTELAEDAGKSIADYLRDAVLSAHAERERRARDLDRKVTLTEQEKWVWHRIDAGESDGLSVKRLEHDLHVQFGEEAALSLRPMLARLRESGCIQKLGLYADVYESVRKPPRESNKAASTKGGK